MIALTTPIQNGNDPLAPYTHAAIRKLDVDCKDKQLWFSVGFGDGSSGMVFSEASGLRLFSIRKDDKLREGSTEWEMSAGYFDAVVSGVGGSVLTVLEQRLVTEAIFTGVVS